MIWINKDNTKPLYQLSIEDLIVKNYPEVVRISKTNDILLFSVTGNVATLVKGSVNDKEHLTYKLLGVEILYESENPNMFAILFNNSRIIASDKKILLDAVRTILMRTEKYYFNTITKIGASKLTKNMYITELKKMYRYFRLLHEKIKEI